MSSFESVKDLFTLAQTFKLLQHLPKALAVTLQDQRVGTESSKLMLKHAFGGGHCII